MRTLFLKPMQIWLKTFIKIKKEDVKVFFFLVEVVGFELTTSWSRTKRAAPALHLDVFRGFFEPLFFIV